MSVSSLPFLHGALAAVLPKLAAWRRDFHAHPEAGWTEFRTAALIIRRLRELGYTIRMGEAACSSDRRMGVPSSAVLAAARERALEYGADAELVAGQEDRAAMAADIAADDDSVTGLGQGPRRMDAVYDLTDTRRRNEQVVDLAFPGYFRIAGDDAHAGFGSRLGHGRSVFFDFGQGEAFFDDEGTRQI